ncbi:hypothetical protein EDC96DRAFT_573396 [Choanephora cucurbitarum]|nr:hypothetical protein EDC96DRAFT_573396 [Choanephora cucurbitarum]
MSSHHNNFIRFFEKCRKNSKTPSFEFYIKSNNKYIIRSLDSIARDECSNWYNMFKRSAAEFGVEVEKGEAEEAWERWFAVAHVITLSTSTLNFREKLVTCTDYGPKSVGFGQRPVEGEDVRRIFKAKRMQTVNLVEQGKPIKENEHLQVPLSCIFLVQETRLFWK